MSENIPPVPGSQNPPPRRGCLFWSASGCLVFAIIAVALIWWFKSFMGDHLVTNSEQASLIAEEIIPLRLPDGMSFEQAFSWKETRAAWGVNPELPSNPLVIFLFRTEGEEADEDSFLKGFEQSRKRGDDGAFIRSEDFALRGKPIRAAFSEYSDGDLEYSFLIPGDSFTTGMVFMGQPDILNHEWVQGILDTVTP